MKAIITVALLIGLCHCFSVSEWNENRLTLGSPIKAIYVDWHVNWSAPAQTIIDAANSGYNVVIIAFWLSSGTPADMAQAWAGLDDGTKQAAIQQVHNAGAVVTVSLGGSTDSPYDKDAFSLGQQVAQWAQEQHLDGVDFDLENIAAGFTVGGLSDDQTVQWIVDATSGAVSVFGSEGIISHAPQAPYFGPIGGSAWPGQSGGYTGVAQKAGSNVTFYNVQFYNQGGSCYTTYQGIFTSSASDCGVFPGTSVAEINSQGVPLSQIVVGKPTMTNEASNGYVDGNTLGGFVSQASGDINWNTGVMGWEWDDPATDAAWISGIYPSISA